MSWAFVIRAKGKIVGALTIGRPANPYVARHVLNMWDWEQDVYELTRLWVADYLPRNTESEFIGWCLREMKMKNPWLVLVSYADPAHGHIGIVYKATGWIYTGISKPRCKAGDRVARRNGGRRFWNTGTNKHRYVWLANRNDRQFLRWDVRPYPKREAMHNREHVEVGGA